MPLKLTLPVAGLLGLAIPALGNSFTLAPASPSGNTYTIYTDGPGGPNASVDMAAFGLGPGDVIDAISAGDDPVRGTVHGQRRFYFSVRRPSQGEVGSGVRAEFPDQMGDIFRREWDNTGTNYLAPAPTGWSGMDGQEANAGLVLSGPGDNVNGLEFTDLVAGGINPPSLSEVVYFSLADGSIALGFYGWSAADILAVGGVYGNQPHRVMTAAQVGLPFEADIDALCVETEIDQVENVPIIRRVAYSISSASTPLNLAGTGHLINSGAAIIGSNGTGTAWRMRRSIRMGMRPEDDINALEMEAVADPITQNRFGLDHEALGIAQVNAGAGSSLAIANIGSSGEDGVRAAVGAAEAVGLTLANLGQWSDTSMIAATLVGFGGQEGEELTEVGRLEVSRDADWWEVQPSVPASVGQGQSLRLYDQGQMVAEIPMQPGLPPAIRFPPQSELRFFHGNGGLSSLGVGTASTSTFEVPGHGMYEADYASYFPISSFPDANITHAAIEARDIQSFEIIDESLQLFGNAHRAIGDAQMLGFADLNMMLNLSNIGSSGQDGVAVETDAANTIEVAVDYAAPAADFAMTCSFDDLLQVLSAVSAERTGDTIDLTAHFPNYEGIPMTVELRLEGATVAILEDVDQANAASIAILSLNITASSENGLPNLTVRTPEPTCLSGLGMPGCITVDEIRFQVQVSNQGGVAAVGPSEFTGFALKARNCDALSITGESTTSAPSCPGDTNGDGVVDVNDLVQVILDWGCTGSCAGDVNGDGIVDVEDLLNVILGWGMC